jgi:hypothetical protein
MKFSKKIGRDEERASEGDNDRVMTAMTTKRKRITAAVTTERTRITTAVTTESDRRVTVAVVEWKRLDQRERIIMRK